MTLKRWIVGGVISASFGLGAGRDIMDTLRTETDMSGNTGIGLAKMCAGDVREGLSPTQRYAGMTFSCAAAPMAVVGGVAAKAVGAFYPNPKTPKMGS